LIDAGDIIAIVESRLASESDPTQHPLYNLVCWVLDKHVAPLDGGQLFDRWHQLVLAAVDTALDDLLEMED
jgi:DNA-binding protein Fis